MERFDVQKEAIDIINQNEYYITGLIRLQLQEGKDGNNQDVKLFGRTHYADRTVFDKEHGHYPPLGKVTDFITNYKTGDFYRSLKTTAEGKTFKTDSNVSYFDEIIERSGDIILKLNKKHRSEFAEEVLIPQLRKRFKQLENGL